MKRATGFSILLIAVGLLGFAYQRGLHYSSDVEDESEERENLMAPWEHFEMVRNYPEFEVNPKAWAQAVAILDNELGRYAKAANFGKPWLLEGPTNIGGRINCIAVDPFNANTIFSGTAYGGIWKTTNGGSSWNPVFDSTKHLSIGAIAMDEATPGLMYAGTGDPCVPSSAFSGNGIYKSVNGGATWTHLGLDSTGIIGDIAIHPANHQVLYAAAMGTITRRDLHRGLYKSVDGGASWTNVLSLGKETGIRNVAISPANPDIVYATGMRRVRRYNESIITGNTTRLYKSTDGGATWDTLFVGGLHEPLCKITFELLPSDPNTIIAAVVDSTLDLRGIFKSTTGGSSWTALSTTGMNAEPLGSFGWYFSQVRVNPFNEQQLFLQGVDLWRSDNGGSSWQRGAPTWSTYQVHADKHDMQFMSASKYYLATDGGLYRTDNNGGNWADIDDIPITQFYRVTPNHREPGVYYGGAQDNGTSSGNAASANNWPRVLGGDGFKADFSSVNPDLMYCEVQNGKIYYYYEPFGFFQVATDDIDTNDRRNWDTPYLLSKHDNKVFAGTQYVYRADDATSPFFTRISPDLTDGEIYGKSFHNISALTQSTLDADILYAGTSDGNVWRTLNSGAQWTNITGNLPERYVTCVTTSLVNPNTVFVSHSGYKADEYVPHVHRSYDNGTTWTDISGDLPPFAVNDVLVFREDTSMIFAATDAGVFATSNGGINWVRVGSNMPVFPVYDLEFDTLFKKVIAGTFSRSMMSYQLDLPRTGIAAKDAHKGLEIYPSPASDLIHVSCEGNIASWTIHNLNGQTVMQQIHAAHDEININSLTKGVYFLRVTGADGKTRTKKFVKL